MGSSNKVNLQRLGEFGFIQRTKKMFGRFPGVVRGIGDDAAVLPYTKREYLLFTTDMVLEGVHFTLKEATPYEIGWKAMGVNLSDIAAMGGIPRFAVVSLGVPKRLSISFYDQLTLGIKALAKKFDVALVGGDTNRAQKLTISIALIGTVEKNRCILRNGAKLGDLIFVTGTLGGSRQGKHLSFIPRVKEARILTRHFQLSSMIDLSDGLASDVARICEESGVGACIQGSSIPLSKGVTLHEAINDGEDFELLFTLPPREAKCILQRKIRLGIRISRIGRVVEKNKGIRMHIGERVVPLEGGFRHF